MNLIKTEEIRNLSREEFFEAYTSGRLNNLDLPAREYFERQNIIREEMKIHTVRATQAEECPYMITKKVLADVTDESFHHAYMTLYAREGEKLKVMFNQSKEEREHLINEYGRTGILDVMDYGSLTTKEIKPHVVVEADIRKIYKRREVAKKIKV